VVHALFDTNILIDDLKGDSRARSELLGCVAGYVSRIAWIELLVGADTVPLKRAALKELKALWVLDVTEGIARRTVEVRQQHRKLKLPDAIIYATALEHGLTLVTRNTRDFNETMPNVRIPYAA
jgi:predicted nucleic acid-binding protein